MKNIINILLFIWQLPQIILGWIVSLFFKCPKTLKYKDSTIRICPKFPGGISLGKTVIVKKGPYSKDTWNTVKHEYGHTIQSKYLGPLYLLIIGIPSFLWAGYTLINKRVNYYKFYTEKWADKLGNVKR